MIRAIILDLDNTIYPAQSIGDELFAPLYELMDKYKEHISEEDLQQAKKDLMKQPFQKIADRYKLPSELKEQGIVMLRDLTYEGTMQPFEDYQYVKAYSADKFLVTMGFTKMQWRKLEKLDLEKDFTEMFVNDPDKTDATKKEVFQDILNKYNYQPNEVVTIGDDPESEIKSGKDLGLITVLYDPNNEFEEGLADYKIASFQELSSLPLGLNKAS